MNDFKYLPESGCNTNLSPMHLLIAFIINSIISIFLTYKMNENLLNSVLILISLELILNIIISILIYFIYMFQEMQYVTSFMEVVYEREMEYKIDMATINFVLNKKDKNMIIKISSNSVAINNVTSPIPNLTAIEQVIYARAIIRYLKNYSFATYYGDYVEEDRQLKNIVVLKAVLKSS